MNKKLLFIFLPLLLIGALAGCSQAYGSATVSENQTELTTPQGITSISSILDKPADYSDKVVVLEGKITQECGSGCWFNLADDSGIIYVDLAPSNLAIPQKVGSKATVTGVVTVTKQTTYLIGKKVEF
jgi:uncharacterized protein YdeI (BOF family)